MHVYKKISTHKLFLIIAATLTICSCGVFHNKNNIGHQPSFISKELNPNLGYLPVAVFPLQNATGMPELNWLSIGLQENLTVDLNNISELNTKTLSDLNTIIKKYCYGVSLSCLAGLNERTYPSFDPLKVSDWQEIATGANLWQFFWGSYQVQEGEVTVYLHLYGGKKWTSQGKLTVKAPISHLLQESSKQILRFLEDRRISIKPEERVHILSPKTESVTAWEHNAVGCWWEQRYIAAGEEEKDRIAKKWEARLKKAIAVDSEYAEAWCNLGYQKVITGDLDGAIKAFRKALDHKPDMVDARMKLGYCLFEKGNLKSAISHLEQGIRLNPSLSGYYGYLMNAYRNARLWQQGLAMLAMLDGFLRERHREAERMEVIWWRAVFLQELERFADSKKAYHEVLSFKETHLGPEHPEVATVVSNLAFLNKTMGEYRKAKSLYERALAIDEKAYGQGHPEVAKDFTNLAGIHYLMGEYARAKLLYERALAIDEKVFGREHSDTARDLNNLAELYRALGEYDKANNLYRQALTIWKKVYGPDHSNVAIVLNNLAELHCDLGEYDKAKPLYEKALTIYQNVYGQEHPNVATVLNNLAGLYYVLREYDKAKPLYERALAIDEKIYGYEHPSVSIRLNNLAELYYATGRYDLAKPLYERALAVALVSGQPEILWRVQLNFGYLLVKKENTGAAIFFGKQAVNTIQGLRKGMSRVEKELQKSFLKTKWHVYKFLADLLIDKGRIPEAQQVLDMRKEEEYFDFLRRNAGRWDVRTTSAAFTDEELRGSERYREIGRRIAALGEEFAELKQKKKLGLTEEETKRYRQVNKYLKISRRTFNNYLTELIDNLSSATRERYAEIKGKRLDKPRKLQQALRELGHGAVVIHYLITDDKLRIILTTTEVQLARDVIISARELNHKIMAYRSTLQNPRNSPLPQARELYQIVLAPIEEDLRQARAKTLMLSLDGALRYLPMAALHDGEGYLVERYLLAIYTAAAGLDIKDKPATRWQVGGFGLSRGIRNLDPLPHVPAELEGIIRRDRSDPDGVMPGVIYLDEAFSKQNLESVLNAGYPVVHIASHFELKPGTEQNSHLVLGDGSTLTLAKIKYDDYDFGNIELITLSACDTAVGGAEANGSEVESFGTLAQDQGAKGVLATLWAVADRSTGILMQNFYRLHTEQPGLTKAEALHRAQLQFIRGENTGKGLDEKTRGMRVSQVKAKTEGEKRPVISDADTSYTHPFYWAPFILMGNWL